MINYPCLDSDSIVLIVELKLVCFLVVDCKYYSIYTHILIGCYHHPIVQDIRMWPSWADMDSDNDNQIGNVSNVRTSCSSQLSLFIPITTSKKYQSRTNRNQKIVSGFWKSFPVTLSILLVLQNYPIPIFHLEIILTFWHFPDFKNF